MRPRRTLVVCSWDGEEVGLTGSTEWGEQFADELSRKPSRTSTLTRRRRDPNSTDRQSHHSLPCWKKPLYALTIPSGKLFTMRGKHTIAKEQKSKHSEPMINSGAAGSTLADTRIGSGSDHTVFLNFIGMPVIGLGFEGDYGVYHSAYDDFYWMNHFGDPGYRYHTLMSQLWGVTALRLANADLLPFNFATYASNIRQFVNELASENSSVILSGAKDPNAACATCGVSGSSQNEPHLDLTAIGKRIDAFEAAGKTLDDQ